MVNCFSAVAARLSVTLTVNVNVAATVGGPEITPEVPDEASVRPVGRVPLATVKVYVPVEDGVPPVTGIVAL